MSFSGVRFYCRMSGWRDFAIRSTANKSLFLGKCLFDALFFTGLNLYKGIAQSYLLFVVSCSGIMVSTMPRKEKADFTVDGSAWSLDTKSWTTHLEISAQSLPSFAVGRLSGGSDWKGY